MKEVTTLVGVAQVAIALLLLTELWLLARFLSWRAGEPRPGFARRAWLAPLLLAALFALPAGLLARSGALAPGVSGAGMPWERVTDDTPHAIAARAGERAYLNRCAPCHLPDGRGLPPAYPALVGSPVLAGPVAAHARIALFGGVRMPAFARAASDAELAAILTYERTAFAGGNPDSTSRHVRPRDVAMARLEGPPAP